MRHWEKFENDELITLWQGYCHKEFKGLEWDEIISLVLEMKMRIVELSNSKESNG